MLHLVKDGKGAISLLCGRRSIFGNTAVCASTDLLICISQVSKTTQYSSSEEGPAGSNLYSAQPTGPESERWDAECLCFSPEPIIPEGLHNGQTRLAPYHFEEGCGGL